LRDLVALLHSQLNSANRAKVPLPTFDVSAAMIGEKTKTQKAYDAECDELTKYAEF